MTFESSISDTTESKRKLKKQEEIHWGYLQGITVKKMFRKK